ncbi:phenoloxidase-activating factor 2-like [Anopheles moucheti]|uniref:phenoloxidase-activating factor 2-like n=1 Tax=Anopheles moucheti TaxID=186751 RepID=UPI0022EFD9D2|nr:phenoloxidase-activating factor 2-like [Anopheles moucheti]
MNLLATLTVACLVVLVVELPAIHGQSCDGKCLPRNKCQRELSDEDDAVPDVDLRIGQQNSDVVGNCPHYLDVCCPPGEELEEPLTHEPTSFQPCGQRNSNGVGFRIGAGKVEESEFGEFPWTLLVLELQKLFDSEEKEVYACVGSLLAPNVALTVAHCVNKKSLSSLLVRAGEWDTRTESEVLPYQDAKVKQVLIHDRYNKQHHYDVALLVLEKPFEAAENIQLICLPPPSVRPPVGTECLTGGWGKDRFGQTGVYQQILKRVTLPIVDQAQCQTALRKTRLGAGFKLHSSFLCAGGKKDADVCSGDGGGALVCLLPGSQTAYYQAGIVAWGIGCGDENIPGVYADVDTVRSWLVDNLNALKVDPTYYTAS